MTEFIQIFGQFTVGQVVALIIALSFLSTPSIIAYRFITKVNKKLDEYNDVKAKTNENVKAIEDLTEFAKTNKKFQKQMIRNKIYKMYLKTKEDGGISAEDLTEFNLNADLYISVLNGNHNVKNVYIPYVNNAKIIERRPFIMAERK